MLNICPPEIHSTYQIIQAFNIYLKGFDVVHLGSHDLNEKDLYQKCKVNKVYAFECNPFLIPDLKERLRDTNWKYFQACLWSEENIEKEFYFYRNKKDGAGGLYKPDRMGEFVDCPTTGESIKLKTTTLDNYILDGIVDISNTKLLVVDLQGAEEPVLSASHELLSSEMLDWIIVETSTFSCYQDGSTNQAIESLLSKYQFKNIGFWKDWGNQMEMHGDAIYKRIP